MQLWLGEALQGAKRRVGNAILVRVIGATLFLLCSSLLYSNSSLRSSARRSKLDTEIGELVDALKAKGMWDNTLLAMFSDNGGPIYIDVDDRGVESYNGGANNYPLRGGKLGNAEGGIRVNSFVSGGFVPEKQRGKTIEGFMATEDW